MSDTKRQMADFFPLKIPRQSQVEAMRFMDEAIGRGYEHIVIEAPTGAGKSLLGATACLSHGSGYYLVTQKLLQDQLESELAADRTLGCFLLKSAVEYPCQRHKNCALGGIRKCERFKEGACSYSQARLDFMGSRIGVTNYPFFLTERLYVNKLGARPILVLDECHSVEKQIINAVEFAINSKQLKKWNVDIEILRTTDLGQFLSWIKLQLMPRLVEVSENLLIMSDGQADDKLTREAIAISQHVSKLKTAITLYEKDPTDWVYWQQEQEDGTFEALIRPLNAAPFAPLLFDSAKVKVHMSAFPGQKAVYCRSLGIDPAKVMWAKLTSSFAPDKRPIMLTYVGQMRKACQEQTLPKAIKFITMILDKHAGEKGLIHSNSYAIQKEIVTALGRTRHRARIIAPLSSEDRETAFELHKNSVDPTVIISPSMTEGFDFMGNLARWQVIVKVPFPNLGDRQVHAKMQRDPEWYQVETVKTIVQMSGRIVRSDDDWGVTYFLDADFEMIYGRYSGFFPNWWKQAVQRLH